jgi:hypothetical protein
MKKQNYRSNSSGGGLVIVIILIVLIGGGLWYLVAHKQAMDKEGRAFGHDAIQQIIINRDLAFLSSSLSPQARLDLPVSEQKNLMSQLQQLGVPAQPFQTEESMAWDKFAGLELFEPKGFFTVHLNYPGGAATLQLAIDHPVSKWQIVNLTFQGPSQAR